MSADNGGGGPALPGYVESSAMPLAHRTPHEDSRVAEARARLDAARQRTRGSLTRLRDEVAEQIDWRKQVRANPGPFLLAAFILGFLLAGRR